jgi:hypothetical protein
VETIFAWVFGIVLAGFMVIYPLSLIYSIYEDMNKKEGTRRSYKYGWFNQRWK